MMESCGQGRGVFKEQNSPRGRDEITGRPTLLTELEQL